MVDRIRGFLSPNLPFKKNAILDYDEDGEEKVLIFFSQEQGLDLLARCTDPVQQPAMEYNRAGIRRCGLPETSGRAPVTITGTAARLLREAKESVPPDVPIEVEHRPRVRLVFSADEERIPACAVIAVDGNRSWHVHLVHSQQQGIDAIRLHLKSADGDNYWRRMDLVTESHLPFSSAETPVHVEHDAALFLGFELEHLISARVGIFLTAPDD